ncbi:MAG: hypothetical protein GY710_13710 [Desulfobacteraceae bacterium]|nr:hypothetical protein [Desulfobacteraceae bacterium]
MNKRMFEIPVRLISRWVIYTLIIFYAVAPGLVTADEQWSESGEETSIEQIETELGEQGLIEDQDKEESGEEATEEEKLQEDIEKDSKLKSAAPMMAATGDTDPADLENTIFDTDLNMKAPDIAMEIGAAVMEYPIQVPKGRNGLTPTVVLNYNSSRENSLAGVGWDLNPDYIQRSVKRGACYTCTDFIYNGEDLLPVKVDDSGYGTYHPEKEQAFSLIEFLPDNSWSVTLKNGNTYVYGTTATSRQDNDKGSFRWLLETVTDTNGNTLIYTYTKDRGRIYPAAIEYSDYYTVSFYYEDRTDIITDYVSLSLVETAKRLKTVTVISDSENIRAYDFSYETSANTSQSLLTQITRYGSDYLLDINNQIYDGTFLPPTKITYDQELSPFTKTPSSLGNLSPGQGFKDTSHYPMVKGDWNGDGRMDIGRLIGSGGAFYVSTGSGFEAFPAPSLTGSSSNRQPVITGDWNGDGKTDIGRVGQYSIVFYVSTGTGWQSYSPLNDLGFTYPYHTVERDQYLNPIITGDWNGDGLTDVARADGGKVTFYISTGTGWQKHFVLLMNDRVSYNNNDEFPILTGDFNGDGLTDVARVGEKGTMVYVSTGSGFKYHTNLGAFSHSGWTPRNSVFPMFVGDFNGDGLSDIGRRVYGGTISTYLSTGTGFVPGGSIGGSSLILFTEDFNGDGRTDIALTSSQGITIYTSIGNGFISNGSNINDLGSGQGYVGSVTTNPFLTGDFTGDGKAGIARVSNGGMAFYSPQGKANDQMSQIITPSGNTTNIEYTPSSAYENIRLPMVLQTVSKITTEDGLGNSAETSYTYAGGLYNYEERELRSFASAVKTNPDGTTDTTLFYQDKFLDGRAYQSQFRALDSSLLSQTDFTWESVPYDDGSAFIKLDSQLETQYEKGGETFSREDYTYSDDTHGSLETSVLSGTSLSESIINSYTYDYFGAGLTYPLHTVRETLSGSSTGLVRQIDYSHELLTGNLLTQEQINTQGDSPITAYEYDGFGNIISITDPRGNATLFDYDTITNTWPVRIEKPSTGSFSHIVQYPSIDYRFGKPLTFDDENGFQTGYTYDEFGRVSRVLYPDGGEEQYIYDDISMPQSVTKLVKESGSGFIKTISYTDGLGRMIQTLAKSNGQYLATLFTFDDMGREECTRGPFFTPAESFLSGDFTGISANPSAVSSGAATTWTRNFYDDRSRVTRTQQSGGIDTYFEYDNLKTRITDPDGNAKTQIQDILGRIIEVIEHGPSDQNTFYTYDPADNLFKVARTNPATGSSIENIVAYNTLDQKTSMTDRDMGHWSYGYDLNGNLISQTDARGVTINFAYDELNRQTKKIYPDASFASSTYDGAANGLGLLHKKSKGNALTEYGTYDKMGRVLSETRTVDAVKISFDYTYDPAGRQASKTVSRNGALFKKLAYEFYPGTSLLARVNGENNHAITEITQYTPQGKIEFLNHANGTGTRYIYDYITARLEAILSYNMEQDIMDKAYLYSKAGDIIEISNNRLDTIQSYEYDHLHRLISEKSSGPGVVAATSAEVLEFTYEDTPDKPVHAPTRVTINGAPVEYSYTATGNRSFKNEGIETSVYESNDDNMIDKISINGTETLFYYDGDNKRIKKTQGQSSTLYFGENFEVVNGGSTLYIFAGTLRVAQLTDTGLKYFHKDHLGSTNALSGEDGTVIDFGEYLPYGLDQSPNDLLNFSSYKFTDQEQDEGTGLYNYDARLYDPAIGQFIMADSMVPDMYNPQSLNRYAYCLNNPLIYVDPSGHLPGGILGTRASGNKSALGYNGEKGFFGSEGKFMGALSYSFPGFEAYAGWHDGFCDDNGLNTKTEKTISNIAIVTLPAFIAISIVDDILGLFGINTNEYDNLTDKEYSAMLQGYLDTIVGEESENDGKKSNKDKKNDSLDTETTHNDQANTDTSNRGGNDGGGTFGGGSGGNAGHSDARGGGFDSDTSY